MVRKMIGKFVEWALGYNRTIFCKRHEFGIRENKYKGDAGYDLYVVEDCAIFSGEVFEVHTGIFLEPKASIWFEIKPRSSTFNRRGLVVQDAVIDNGYRGELTLIVHNPSFKEVRFIKKGDRIAQIIPHHLLPCKFIVKDKLSESQRGKQGFGSSGI